MSDSENWSRLWKGLKPIEFGREPYMWKFYELLLAGYDFRGKSILEMGCGTGINTILMAKRGARVTFLDFSRDALDIVKRNAEIAGVKGRFVLGNILDVDFDSEFDLVHSEGVIEHFRGHERQEVLNRHARAAKRGGVVAVIVPQAGSLFYRLGKFMAEATGAWIHGKEYPYTKNELHKRMEMAGLSVDRIVGGELFIAFGWLFSPLWLRDGRILERSLRKPADMRFFRLNYNNWAANRWGRVLGGTGVKI